MQYLLARCPVYDCNQKRLISALHSQGLPEFEPHVFVIVRCTYCGQEFKEIAARVLQKVCKKITIRRHLHARSWNQETGLLNCV